jgi:uncharacterized membrane protein YfcA
MAPTTRASNRSLAGLALIALTGLIHLIEAPEYFQEQRYVGVLFVAAAIGAAISMYGIVREKAWGWFLGLAVAGGSVAAYLASRTIGLPGFRENSLAQFLEPSGLFSLVVEILFCVVAIRVLSEQSGDLSTETYSSR